MHGLALAQLVVAALLLAACAAPPARPAAPAASAAPVAPAGSAQAPAPASQPAQAPRAAPPDPIRVTLGSGVVGMGNAPVTVAREKGYFADEGIDLDWQLLQGGSVVAAGLSSGNIQFGDGSAADVVGLNVRGLPMIVVGLMSTRILFDVIVRKDFAAAKGVTPDSSLVDRILALKNARMGVSSLGGAPDRYGRWLMTKAGLTPDDVDNNRVGGTPEIRTAMRQALIDGALTTPPAGPTLEQEGVGLVLIRSADVPEWQDFPFSLIYTPKSYADANGEAVTRMVRAVVRGSRFIQDNPPEAKQIIQTGYKDVPPDLLSASVDSLSPAFTRDGRMTEQQWDNAMAVLVGSGATSRALDTREGGVWTNQYVTREASGR